MENIFLSFRSSDTKAATRSIYQSLVQEFGRQRIFYFPESNFAGDRFEEKIFSALEKSAIFIAIIGREYVSLQDELGQVRIFQEDDLVRRELVYALENNLTIIPILVDDTPFPRRNELPDDLQELLEIDFHNINFNKGYDYGIQKLIETIRRNSAFAKPKSSDALNRFVKLAMAAAALLAVVSYGIFTFTGNNTVTGVDAGAMLNTEQQTSPPAKEDSLPQQLADENKPSGEVVKKEVTTKEPTQQNKPTENIEKVVSKPQSSSTHQQDRIIKTPAMTQTNYFLSNQNYQIGVLQLGSKEFYDFSQELKKDFLAKGLSSSSNVLNNDYISRYKDQLLNESSQVANKHQLASKLNCLCVFNQNLEVKENALGSGKIVSLKLNGDLILYDLIKNTRQVESVNVGGSGSNLENALRELRRRFAIHLQELNLNTSVCQ